MEVNQRVEWIDIAKGITIVLIILLHSCTSAIRDIDFVAFLIYSFTVTSAVPVLMFLSGCSFALRKEEYCKMSLKDYSKKKATSLLIPYIVYAFLIYLIFEIVNLVPVIRSIMANAGYGHMSFITFVKGLLIGNNEFSIHLWYLYALFLFDIIAYLVIKYRNKYVLLIISILLFVFSLIYTFSVSMAWEGAVDGLVFFTLGICFGEKKCNNITAIGAMIIWIALFYMYINWQLYYGNDYFLPNRFIPFAAIIVISSLSKLLRGSLAKILRYLGLRSMVLYLFQQPFFGSALGTVLVSVLRVPAFFAVMICIIASFTMPLLIRRIFVRYGWFRYLFRIR